MTATLASCRAKLERAEKHRAELYREIARFRKGDPFRVRPKDDPHTRETTYDIRPRRPIPARWQAILGDSLHNYRCVLDHLVWTLVCNHGTRSDKRQFPITLSKTRFDNTFPNCVGVVNRKGVKAAFERLQPYKRSNRPSRGSQFHPLWLLHRLDIVDKHREILVPHMGEPLIHVGASIPASGFSITRSKNKGTEMISIVIPFDSHGPVKVEPKVAFDIRIGVVDLGRDGRKSLGAATNLSLVSTLDDIASVTQDAFDSLADLCN